MDCTNYRDALSARLDGEDEHRDPVAPTGATGAGDTAAVDRHLASCGSCRDWWDHSNRLRRMMRLTPAPDVPDLTDRITAVAVPPRREHWGLRIPLAVVGLLQSGLGLSQLLGSPDGHGAVSGMAAHLGHESAAWNLAIGFALLWAALRPHATTGLLPLLTVFTGVLGVVSVVDLIGGAATAGRVLSHGIVVAGVCLLALLRRRDRDNGPTPASVEPAADTAGRAATGVTSAA
ncbi:hypothetical protein [Saccharomonospora sp. CUA-673]|uniref:hypothetical protein n=1 Tax=Saccharomonospora sp. CUA-673 TaxID=1904969 RepID=UPI0009FAB2E4|nr:hypothetical protein [Saccharomonospora sp. CUA-673]